MSTARTWIAAAAIVGLSALTSGCSTKRPEARPELDERPSAAVKPLVATKQADVAIERVNVPVTGAEPHKGPADALVTIVMFADFECPFCGRVQPALASLVESYGPRLRMVWRNLPLDFHANAQPAAEAAWEAYAQGKDEAFWAMHDKLLANQKALARKDLEQYANELGLDLTRFRAALDKHTHASAIQADAALAARVGATGTPVFFINGRPLQGALPMGAFKSLIDDELQRVQPLLTSVVPADLYATLVAKGQPRAQFEVVRPRRSPFEPTVYHVPVSNEDPQRGARDALVTIVLFGDFECEYTERALHTLSAIEEKYGRDLRLVWKHRPMSFHDHAYAASTLAMKAFERGGSELFWQASELLFQNRTALGRTDLENYGQQLGLTTNEVRTALEGDPYKAKIDADKALSLRIAFAPTTPSFAINGRYLRGAQSREIFELLVEEELAKAKARVASGTPRERVYDELIKDGALAPIEIAPGTVAADAKKVHELAIPKQAPRKGAEDAKVVIQEFGDFQCPFCRQVQATLQQLLAENKESVALVWRNYPLPSHEHARLAAEAAEEVRVQAGNDKFWAYHDLLFANQSALTRAELERHAQSLGMNMAKFRQALDTHRHQAAIHADLAAVEATGEQVGTPAFLVNGLLIAGAQPIDVFKVAVQRALLRRNASASAAGKTAR